MGTAAVIAGIVGTAFTLAKGTHDIVKGAPKMPEIPPPPEPEPMPEPKPLPEVTLPPIPKANLPPQPSLAAPPLPPAPTETLAGEAVATERRKRATRFGVADTLLASPLGSGGLGTPVKTLLGG